MKTTLKLFCGRMVVEWLQVSFVSRFMLQFSVPGNSSAFFVVFMARLSHLGLSGVVEDEGLLVRVVRQA